MLRNVDLWTRDGFFSTPDGSSIYFWGLASREDGKAQLPGPLIVVQQGDTVRINLTNTLPEATSLLFPGQEGVTVDDGTGPRPVQPRFGPGGVLTSFTDYADYPDNPMANPTRVTYAFTPENPGTYLYWSGTNVHRQVLMGLHGCLIVRPADYDESVPARRTAYGEGTGTEFDREYVLVLAEVDPELNYNVEHGFPYRVRDYKPRYWTMNGRCAVDTMLPSGVGYLPTQPYGSMITAEPGEKVLFRYAGGGIENHPLHPHGNHTRIVGLDGRLLRNGATDLSYKRFTVLVGPGQTYDQIFIWTGLGFDPVTHPIPTVLPQLQNLAVGHAGNTLWSGSAYLGLKGDLPVGVTDLNDMGEYYFMLHSHEEVQITNWGKYPGGLMTMVAVFPSGRLGERHGRIPYTESVPV